MVELFGGRVTTFSFETTVVSIVVSGGVSLSLSCVCWPCTPLTINAAKAKITASHGCAGLGASDMMDACSSVGIVVSKAISHRKLPTHPVTEVFDIFIGLII